MEYENASRQAKIVFQVQNELTTGVYFLVVNTRSKQQVKILIVE